MARSKHRLQGKRKKTAVPGGWLGITLTRSSSVCGSFSSLNGTLRTAATSSALRCRTNTGLPRHLKVTFLPTPNKRGQHMARC